MPILRVIVNSGNLTTNYLPKGLPTDPVSTNQNGCDRVGAYAYGSGTSGWATAYIVGAFLENANGGNTWSTHMNTGATGNFGYNKTFSATLTAGTPKGAGFRLCTF